MKEKDLVLLLGSCTFVVIIWLAANLYHSFITSTIEEPLTTLLKPISNTFNAAGIQKIGARQETPPTYELEGSPERVTPTDSASGKTDTSPESQVTPTGTPEITPTEELPIPTATITQGEPTP